MSDIAMRATETLLQAAEMVAGPRAAQHGPMLENFDRIAALWNAWLGVRNDPLAALSAEDVGQMMILLKMARTQTGAFNPDDYLDAAGYAGCVAEIAHALHKQGELL